jgi:hypothetical protein
MGGVPDEDTYTDSRVRNVLFEPCVVGARSKPPNPYEDQNRLSSADVAVLAKAHDILLSSKNRVTVGSVLVKLSQL